MNRSDYKSALGQVLKQNQNGDISPEIDKQLRELSADNVPFLEDDVVSQADAQAGTSNVVGLISALVLRAGINAVVSQSNIRDLYEANTDREAFTSALKTKLETLIVGEARYIKGYADINDAPTSGIDTDSYAHIGGLLHRFNGSAWAADTVEIKGADIISLIDQTIGTGWKEGGTGGGSGEYLTNIDGIGNAPTSGVPTNAIRIIDDKFHKFNGTAWEDISEELDGGDIIPLIDAVLGTGWKSGGGGGSSFDINNIEAGFWGSERGDWVVSGGDIVTIKDLGSAHLYAASGTTVKYDGSSPYITGDGSLDGSLDLNNGVADYMQSGTGAVSNILVIDYRASSGDRHIKYGGSNTYKVNPTGIEVRNNGVLTETLGFTFTSGTTYFIAIKRDNFGFHHLYVGTIEKDVQHVATSVNTSFVDMGALNGLSFGENERIYGLVSYREALSDESINELYQKAKADFTLG